MIIDRETARTVLAELFSASGALDQSVQLVAEQGSQSELAIYRRAVGCVLGELWDKVLAPILIAHPDLRPSELGNSRD